MKRIVLIHKLSKFNIATFEELNKWDTARLKQSLEFIEKELIKYKNKPIAINNT